MLGPTQWRSGTAFASNVGDRGLIPSRDRPLDVFKTDIDSSTVKRSATGVRVTGPRK